MDEYIKDCNISNCNHYWFVVLASQVCDFLGVVRRVVLGLASGAMQSGTVAIYRGLFAQRAC